MRSTVYKPLLAVILSLAGFGFVIFLSASMGLVARESGASFQGIVFNQAVFGLIPGLILMFFLSRLPHKVLRRYSLLILLAAFVLSALVFVPGLGFAHGGAKRWISIGSNTFQPSEMLKIAVLIYLSAWFAMKRHSVGTLRFGAIPFVTVLALSGLLLLSEPDIDTFLVIFTSTFAVYLSAGARIKHALSLVLICALLFAALVFNFPYLKARILTFVDPSRDTLGSSYQIQQSLIAIGSGGFWGKGFGKSVQKFSYLPEPVGDSIFAVASEEFGFVGSVTIILLFFLLATFGLRVANQSPDPFGRYLAIGIVVMIITQALINIGAMIGILPLSGITLPFISHGGTALLFSLAEAGILLSISRSFL